MRRNARVWSYWWFTTARESHFIGSRALRGQSSKNKKAFKTKPLKNRLPMNFFRQPEDKLPSFPCAPSSNLKSRKRVRFWKTSLLSSGLLKLNFKLRKWPESFQVVLRQRQLNWRQRRRSWRKKRANQTYEFASAGAVRSQNDVAAVQKRVICLKWKF